MGRSALKVLVAAGLAVSACHPLHGCGIGGPAAGARGNPAAWAPAFTGRDAKRPRIDVRLTEVAGGINQVTDLAFAPGDPTTLYALQKGGVGRWLSLAGGKTGRWLKVTVRTASEEGLLGLAFHPRFPENGRLFLDYVVRRGGRDVSQVAEWRVPPGRTPRQAAPVLERVLLEVVQPYADHDGGQLAFGPDGYLYVGVGDGGSRGDPHGNGQDRGTLLGSLLRLDVDHPADGKAYGIPKDNPFVGQAGVRPREGRHCYPPGRLCNRDGTVDPVYEYGRDEGQSVVGGFVYTGDAIPALKGLYVFGDFVAGRLWAIALPASPVPPEPLPLVHALGRWPMTPSTFGRGPDGARYVGDFTSGRILRIDPPAQAGTGAPKASDR